jgi:hypothetical protein
MLYTDFKILSRVIWSEAKYIKISISYKALYKWKHLYHNIADSIISCSPKHSKLAEVWIKRLEVVVSEASRSSMWPGHYSPTGQPPFMGRKRKFHFTRNQDRELLECINKGLIRHKTIIWRLFLQKEYKTTK